ncbi:hypothetical protein SAMN05428953_11858 [Mesorhizobium muleiense]|uniref:Uncharacterized protein n=1 Tax=Mesorhizobium muleiense TaxID=1004279 RepID=A0A1G9DM31_9HYPH|nr:hypothetical protein SAMN05428953_11858 [Mesorhizobium muleiense]
MIYQRRESKNNIARQRTNFLIFVAPNEVILKYPCEIYDICLSIVKFPRWSSLN